MNFVINVNQNLHPDTNQGIHLIVNNTHNAAFTQ